jgi:hypothetical protein
MVESGRLDFSLEWSRVQVMKLRYDLQLRRKACEGGKVRWIGVERTEEQRDNKTTLLGGMRC